MTKFAYIVLHYKNINDTIECLQSIKDKYNSPIIVVDNATMNNDDIKTIKTYTNDLILLEENKGFAKANNIGCKYAIEKYSPDYLVVINNDILITDMAFESKIESCYMKTKFDILGPKINTNNGDSVNPFRAYRTLEEVEHAIARAKRNISIFKSKIKRLFFSVYHKFKYFNRNIKHLENGQNALFNVPLHGCALIFSKKYYQKYEYVFYNETFLYHEEEFLFYRVNRDKLISYYDPNIECFHKEGSSLNFTYNKRIYEKEIFRNKEILKSLNLLYDAMRNNKEV